jgi:hypothetical protein
VAKSRPGWGVRLATGGLVPGEGNAVDDLRDAVLAVADAAPVRACQAGGKSILQSQSSQVRSSTIELAARRLEA